MILKKYEKGDKLAENEYLLKIRKSIGTYNTGFFSKLTQKGELPKLFNEWGGNDTKLPIYIYQETAASGWKILHWRFGQSQNWATMKHPYGFTVEIYLQQLLELIREHQIVEGTLIGKFYWKDNKLIHEK